jgi:protein-tyrosine phosphatase
MIDLHCHLLPGVDDGPGSLDDALAMCRVAVADGTSHAVVTPHIHPGRWDNNRESIKHACAGLQQRLRQLGIDLELGFAAEARLSDEVLRLVETDQVPFYGKLDGYQVMLLEFPHGHIIPGSEKLVKWLLRRGIRPLIAHPERNRQVMRDISCLQPFLDMGCLLQLTAGAVTGHFGPGAGSVAQQLLKRDAVAVVASDGHNLVARRPELGRAFRHIAQHFGQPRAERLMLRTPAALVSEQFAGRSVNLAG